MEVLPIVLGNKRRKSEKDMFTHFTSYKLDSPYKYNREK